MQARHWILALTLPSFLMLTSGCMQQEFAYVDEFGNELAVDAEGRPLIPRHGAPQGDTMHPAAVAIAAPAAVAPTSQPAEPAAATEPAPAAVDASNELDMPPVPAATGSAEDLGVAMPMAGAAAPKAVESSSKLDIPPAG